ncbi:unnamed protein product [Medioppia subpectinata]|uniref:Uncharacterized protein n=1 Tax=Medioppia subpectinata TaxID=1979941 RepID=A0A7R9Q953_9ACAR|nr:unnamed protein product [Medioppia subpectinata]CAG2116887.1 unnamed protein product [Medioppia subpectinata]
MPTGSPGGYLWLLFGHNHRVYVQRGLADFSYKVVLTCSGAVGSATDFGDNLRLRTKGYQIDDFILSAYPNARLPDTPFDTTTVVKRVIIKDSPKLEGFGPKGKATGFFTGLGATFETLVLSNNPAIRAEEWEAIGKQVKTIKTLVIHKAPEFDDLDALAALAPTLQTLVLRATGLTTFKVNLSTYANLAILDLSETPALKKFDTTVPAKLKNVFISGAGLDTLSQKTLTELVKADFVDLSKNNLNCDCSNFPADFVNEANEKKFLGSTCATPTEIKGSKFATTCLNKNFLLFGKRARSLTRKL